MAALSAYQGSHIWKPHQIIIKNKKKVLYNTCTSIGSIIRVVVVVSMGIIYIQVLVSYI